MDTLPTPRADEAADDMPGAATMRAFEMLGGIPPRPTRWCRAEAGTALAAQTDALHRR